MVRNMQMHAAITVRVSKPTKRSEFQLMVVMYVHEMPVWGASYAIAHDV